MSFMAKLKRNNSRKLNNFYLNLAFEQAKINLGFTKKNPSVGCVIEKNGSIISSGITSLNGRPHAEVNAIKNSVENLERWHKNNYMGVANEDLWKVLHALIYESNRFVYMTHVRRGSCTGNVISDALAQGASADSETYIWDYKYDLNRWLERNPKQRAKMTKQTRLKIDKKPTEKSKPTMGKKKTGSLGF